MDGLALDQMMVNILNPPAIVNTMGGDREEIDTPRAANKPAGNSLDEPCRRWLAEMGAGNEQALGALYDATASRVYGLVLRIVANRESAEDVTQSVYLQLWRDATKFDPARGKPITWILTIARSRALDHLRRLDEAELHPEPETLRPDLAIDGHDPQDLLLACERNHAIYRALEKLTAGQRQLIALAFFKGLTHDEMATHTGMALGSVKTTVRTALQRLHKELETRYT